MSRPPSPAKLRKAADRWTADHPIGTAVRYWSGFRAGDGRTGVTSSRAEILGGHTVGVYIERAGFHALTHVEALPAADASDRHEPTPARPLLASRSQLAALRIEAHSAGDDALVDLCFAALDPDAPDHAAALTRCTEAIVEALGNDEPDLSTVVAIADMLGLGWTWSGRERVIVTAAEWRIHAMMDDGQSSDSPGLCWCANDTSGEMSDESGGWDSLADIEATLRALGGVE